MRRLGATLLRIGIVMFISGFFGATLVRYSAGFGVDERELDSRLSQESVQALRASSLPRQSLPAYYLSYIRRLAHGDWGYSKSLEQPVRVLIAQRFPETLRTIGLGLLVSWSLGMSLAIAPLLLRAGSFDVFASLLAGVLLCLPAGVLTLLFVLTRGPARMAVGLILLPKVYRYAHSILRQSVQKPHVLTAWAKGSGKVRVFVRHVLPVAMPQLLAVGGISITLAFAAAIPVEVIGDLPGIGQLAWKAALARDLELLVSLTLLVTLITLVSNTISDTLKIGMRLESA